MGMEAYRHSCFDGAVSFYQALSKIFKQQQLDNSIHLNGERSFNLSYEHVKSTLGTFVRIHDTTLAEKGQFGITHSCRSQPYKKISNLKLKPSKRHNDVHIMSRDSLVSYRFDPTAKERATRDQVNKLCFGERLKVH